MNAPLHLHSRDWGVDAASFNPDRWDDKNNKRSTAEGEAAEGQAFAPLGIGMRKCIGQVAAILMFKMFVVGLVSRYRFESVDGRTEKIELVNGSVRSPKGVIRCGLGGYN